MPRSGLAKKLQPAKKALKRFTNSLQSRLHSFDFSKVIKVIKTNTTRLVAYCSLHFFLPFKKRYITKPRYRSHQYNHLYTNKTLFDKAFSPIYIDQLYASETSTAMPAKHLCAHAAETSGKGKDVVDEKVVTGKEGKAGERSLYSIEDAWREVVAKSPQLRPVDERAEEFIHKFREEIKLQKEKSILEFDERLARSA